MVAYSFQSQFASPIIARTKRQTIRAHRKRHARPGETLQLFTGMRTKYCRKIISDPVCIRLDEVAFDLRGVPEYLPLEWQRARLLVNGIPTATSIMRDAYAAGDGFDFGGFMPFEHMVRFWLRTHGHILFEGVAIVWEDQ